MYKGIYNDAVNRINESIVWTHKIQRTHLEILEERRKVISIFEIFFTTAAGIATTMFAIFNNNLGTIMSSVCILFSVILSSVLEKVETKNDIDAFRKSSSSLWLLRCKVEELALRIKGNDISDEEVAKTIEFLQVSFDSAVYGLPTIPNKSLELASKKLKDRKDEEVEIKLL